LGKLKFWGISLPEKWTHTSQSNKGNVTRGGGALPFTLKKLDSILRQKKKKKKKNYGNSKYFTIT
jgi:hypothetical protein